MKCSVCERQVGSNALPGLCWWCRESLRLTDERDEVVPPSELREQLTLNLQPIKSDTVSLPTDKTRAETPQKKS